MQINSAPISPDKQALLSKWLDEPAFDILIEVLESVRFDVQIEAVKAREGAADSGHAASAAYLDETARELANMVLTLTKFKQQKEPFTTSTAKP